MLAELKLDELKAIIDREGLDVKKNVGGRTGRTKEDIAADIEAARRSRAGSSSSTPSTPRADSHISRAATPQTDLRAFIDEHRLPVSKAIGGRARRTKHDLFNEIRAAWSLPVEDDTAPMETTPTAAAAEPMRITCEVGSHFQTYVLRPRLTRIARSLPDGLRNQSNYSKFLASPRDFAIDDPSSKGLAQLLGLTTIGLAQKMAGGVAQIEREMTGPAALDVDRECLHYVLHERAGTNPTRFYNGVRDEDQPPRTLHDYVLDCESHTGVALEVEEVLAIRLYSTMAHDSINKKLRAQGGGGGGGGGGGEYPFPATIGFLASGIKKLREADRNKERPYDLFRGMANLEILSSAFMAPIDGGDYSDARKGGTERALMSTSASLETAIRYSASRPPGHTPLIFKIKTAHFRERGGNVTFLSCFPQEKEVLFPPLTFLQPTGRVEQVGPVEGVTFTVVEVTPDID